MIYRTCTILGRPRAGPSDTMAPPRRTPAGGAVAEAARYPDLATRTVFVSGGGSGIGAAFVRAFAAQGAAVAFVDVDEAASTALASELGARVGYWRCDVRDIAALRASLAAAA